METECVFFEIEAELLSKIHINVSFQSVNLL